MASDYAVTCGRMKKFEGYIGQVIVSERNNKINRVKGLFLW